MKELFLLLPAALLMSCSGNDSAASDAGAALPPDLETAAIAAGVIQDPKKSDITGLYARDTDRLCIVPYQRNFRAGVFVDYGDRQSCSGTATATRVGETLHLAFSAAPGCDFDARFDGDTVIFPGNLPAACRKLCNSRASLAGLAVGRLSESVSEAATLRDAEKRLLCTAE